jgi:transcriptional regulator with XRE-family HTH domain
MVTRIKQVRKQRSLTLQRLADIVGTTAQTIQRLETGKMTMSVEWLERIAKAFDMNAAMLLNSYAGPSVPLIGEVVSDGAVKRLSSSTRRIEIAVPVEDPIAVTLRERFGPYEPGTVLIGTRFAHPKARDVDGRDALVELASGRMLFRRVVYGRGGPTAFVPYEDGSPVERNLEIAWIAPVVMAVRYMQAA